MSKKKSAIYRRKRALSRLEEQLKMKLKPEVNEYGTIALAPLSEKDEKRIKKEIETIKERI